MKNDPVNPRLRREAKSRRKTAANLEAFNRCARILDPLNQKTRQTALRALAIIYA
jgi:hypothetical protein